MNYYFHSGCTLMPQRKSGPFHPHPMDRSHQLSLPSSGYWARPVSAPCALKIPIQLDTPFCSDATQPPLGAFKASLNLCKLSPFLWRTLIPAAQIRQSVWKSDSKFWCLRLRFLVIFSHVISAFRLDSKESVEKLAKNEKLTQHRKATIRQWKKY